MQLPDFPWDSLTTYRERAAAHPSGLVDLSVGSPVDPTPEVVRRALAEASDAPSYPLTWGMPALREAVAAWFARRRGVPTLDPDGVMPTIGSKELVAWLPTLMGCGPGDLVGFPAVAYPTYDVGARIAGATPLPISGLTALGPLTGATTPRLLWLNTPSNPTGQVLGLGHLAKVVSWARRHGVVVASDECYAEMDWRPEGERDRHTPTTPSLLDPRVCDGSHEGLLCVYSLSKQSNLAGYRAAFVAGDPALVRRLLEVRKHAGMIMPAPVQHAMVAALGDDEHVAQQRERYARRRALVRDALEAAGFTVDHSEGGLYLWATNGEDCWHALSALADQGLLVTPGSFYGRGGGRHVRVALTVTDEGAREAARRLRATAA